MKRQTVILAAIAAFNILLGFLSSWYVMTRLGTGSATDALFAGSTIPGLVLNIVSASLTSVLVPILATTDRGALRQEAWNFLAAIGMVFGGTAALLIVTAPVWVPYTVPGFDGAARQLTIYLTQIQLLAMIFTALSSVLWCVCYAKEIFLWTELSGLLGTVIGVGLLYFALPHVGVAAAAWMVVVENGLQTALLLPLIGCPRRLDLRSAAVQAAWRQMRPLMLGTSYYKSDQLVDRLLASMTPAGSLSLLNLGQTIYASGHQMISRTLVSTIVPSLARNAQNKHWSAFGHLTFGRLMTITALTGSAAAAMVPLGQPALALLFGHGRIGPHDIHRLWLILLALAGFWIAGGGGFVTNAAFYARSETVLPAKVSAWTYSLYIPIKIYAAWHYGILGIAASISLFHVVNTLAQAVLTSRFLRRANGGRQGEATEERTMTTRLRVATVNPRYYPVFGGTENQARLLIRQMKQDGQVDVPFVVTTRLEDRYAPSEIVDDVPVLRLGRPGLQRWKNYYFYLSAFLFLLARRKQYDVIHCHATSVVGFAMTLAGLLARRPVVLLLATNGEMVRGLAADAHQRQRGGQGRIRLHGRLARFTGAHAHIVGLNKEGEEELSAAGARFPICIPFGVDTTVFRPLSLEERTALRAQHGFGTEDLVFLFTGRFVARKGIDVLLPAFDALLETGRYPRAHLCFAGSGALQPDSVEDQMRQMAQKHPGQVHILPPKTPVAEYLQMADTFVFPSRQEGLPNAILEALAVGLPCLLSDIPPHQELKQGNPKASIALHRCGDADALQNSLERHAADRSNAETATPARTLDDAFHIQSVAARYATLYQRITAHV